MITVEYRISGSKRQAFLAALEKLSHERRRDGAYAWGVFEDTAKPESNFRDVHGRIFGLSIYASTNGSRTRTVCCRIIFII